MQQPYRFQGMENTGGLHRMTPNSTRGPTYPSPASHSTFYIPLGQIESDLRHPDHGAQSPVPPRLSPAENEASASRPGALPASCPPSPAPYEPPAATGNISNNPPTFISTLRSCLTQAR